MKKERKELWVQGGSFLLSSGRIAGHFFRRRLKGRGLGWLLSVIIFKEVNLVNRGVWVDKDLASQRSLLRKLLKEATRKLLEEAS